MKSLMYVWLKGFDEPLDVLAEAFCYDADWVQFYNSTPDGPKVVAMFKRAHFIGFTVSADAIDQGEEWKHALWNRN